MKSSGRSRKYEGADLETLESTHMSAFNRASSPGIKLVDGKKSWEVRTSSLLLGRDPRNDIVLPSTKTSRHHAAIYRLGTSYMVKDLHSRNGVRVNGERTALAAIRPGDTLSVSDQEFKVVAGDLPAEDYLEEVNVVFLDIADFTSLTGTEGSPFVKKIAAIIDRLCDEVLVHGGCPIQTMGDGLFAVFGLWADPKKNQPEAALDFAQKACYYVRSEITSATQSRHSTHARVGIARGPVVYSSTEPLSIMGDTVNLASRIESINKVYHSCILVEDGFAEHVGHRHYLKEIDSAVLKGAPRAHSLFLLDEDLKNQEIVVTEVTNREDREAREKAWEYFDHGYFLYRKGEFNRAAECFEVAHGLRRLGAYEVMLKRSRDLEKSAPAAWDGIWRFAEK